MKDSSRDLIHEAFSGSSEGRLHFGQVIGLLVEAGVESYVADYRGHRTTYYLANDETLALELQTPRTEVAQEFNANAVKAAILGAQQGTVMYPEFKRLSMEAGCVGYTVWIAGRHVSYFGRKGETHVERFPD